MLEVLIITRLVAQKHTERRRTEEIKNIYTVKNQNNTFNIRYCDLSYYFIIIIMTSNRIMKLWFIIIRLQRR